MISSRWEYIDIYKKISDIKFSESDKHNDVYRFKYFFDNFVIIKKLFELIKQNEYMLNEFVLLYAEGNLSDSIRNQLIIKFKELHNLLYPIKNCHGFIKFKLDEEFNGLEYFIINYDVLLDCYDFKVENNIEKIRLVDLLEKIKLFNNKKLGEMVSLKTEYFKIYKEIESINLENFNKIHYEIIDFKYYYEHFDIIKNAVELIDEIKEKEESIYNFFTKVNNNGYLSNSKRNKLITEFKELYDFVNPISDFPYLIEFKIYEEFNDLECFIEYYESLLHYNDSEGYDCIREINETYIENKINENKEFFDDIKDINKKRAIVMDEDNIKVVAGAGAGKTFIIENKVDYLINIKNKNPEKILCLCYTRKSANQLKQRLNKKFKNKNKKVKVFTFHEFCRRVAKDCGKKKRPNRYLLDEVIRKYVSNIIKDPKKLADLMEYFSYSQFEEKGLDILDEYEEYSEGTKLISLKKKVYSKDEDILTLNEDKVDSIGELIIANYLFIHEIEYEYHKKYPYNYFAAMIKNQFLYSGNYFSMNNITDCTNEELIKKFISWEEDRTSSEPDFYIPEKQLYLEHFGVDKNMEASFLKGKKKEKYEMNMRSKQVFHELYGTKLIETYFYYLTEGRLLKKLEEILENNKVTIGLMDNDKIAEILIYNERVNDFKNFSKLVKSFINIYESRNLKKANFNEFRQWNNTTKNVYDKKRQELFLNMVEEIYNIYCDENTKGDLSHNHEIFNALKLIQTKEFNKKYDYIFIDEYQDINRVRCKLLQELQKNSNSKIFVVGDDWQSIYGFSGSEVELFVNFDEYFENPETIQIKENRRNPQELINVTSEFIKDYNNQDYRELEYYKKLKNHNPNPIKIVKYNYGSRESKTLKLDAILTEILKHSHKPRILILGRNNYDIDDYLGNLFKEKEENNLRKIIYYERQDLEIYYMTIHQAKGLQADEVIVLNFEDKYDGFPNKMRNDPVLSFVNDTEENEFDEERRILYVALTRTLNNVYLLASHQSTSEFINQLLEYDGVEEQRLLHRINKENINSDFGFGDLSIYSTEFDCPYCDDGKIAVIVNHNNKTKYIRCSEYPRSASHYNGGPLPSKYPINDKYIEKCPNCDGVLIRRGNILRCSFNYDMEYEYSDNSFNIERCRVEKELKLDDKDLEFDYE